MQNLNFDNGLKTYMINDDENCFIQFNPTDFGFLERLEKTVDEISKIYENYKINKDKSPISTMAECDKMIREKINYVFNGDITTAAFGKTNCLSLSNGNPIFQNFFSALIPIVKNDIIAESRKAQKNIDKYTSQITK